MAPSSEEVLTVSLETQASTNVTQDLYPVLRELALLEST